MKDPDFDKKLKNINKNELNELSEKVKLLSTKGYNFLLSKLLVFVLMLYSVILDNNKRTNWISTGISPKKINHLMLILP